MTILLSKSELQKFYVGNDNYNIDIVKLLQMVNERVQQERLGRKIQDDAINAVLNFAQTKNK